MKSRQSIFVSYSHADDIWLERLKVHLKPLVRDWKLDIWQDTRLKPGLKWREEIQKALNSAKIAILLISADFLASDFIVNDELPPLLKAAEDEGAIILPVIVSSSLFNYKSDLSQFQAVNSPSEPLLLLEKGKQEEVFVKVAETIYNYMVSGSDIDTSNNTLRGSADTENFLSKAVWTKLVKIGDWIIDTKNNKFIGAGMNNYLLSRNEFGESSFSIRAKLKFSNYDYYKRFNDPEFNGGIVCGWKSEKSNPRYYNIVLSGTQVSFERIGFDGGDAFQDFKTLSEGGRLFVEEDQYYDFFVSYTNQKISFVVNEKFICSFDVPGSIIGRVGIRPWRSQVDCLNFEINRE